MSVAPPRAPSPPSATPPGAPSPIPVRASGFASARQLSRTLAARLPLAPAYTLFRLATVLRRSFFAAIEHDFLTVGQAVAYSAVLALFPTLIVCAAVVGILPDSLPFRFQMAMFFTRILPANVVPLLQGYFATHPKNPQTVQALLGSLLVGLTGAANVMSTLMEGFRRAHDLPIHPRSFWLRRGRALALVPLSLVPMAMASVLVVFGHFLTTWLAGTVAAELRSPVYIVAFILRWTVALAGSAGIIAVIYHLGTDLNIHVREQLEPMVRDMFREPWAVLRRDWSWRASLPGAALATFLWFVTTLLFGLYVTRFANYSRVYGSLGAGIALMVWLYLVALCILLGAEFNAQLAADRRRRTSHSQPLPHPAA